MLEQTITKRFPELDREITAARAELQDRSFELQDLTNKLARRDEELSAAERAAANYQEELKRLHQVLEKSAADRSGRRVRRASQWDIDDYRAEYDRLNLELSKLRQQLAQLQDRDAQQVGVIKGELHKLAELILASAQPKPVSLQAEWSELGGEAPCRPGCSPREAAAVEAKQYAHAACREVKLSAAQAQEKVPAASQASGSLKPRSDRLTERREPGAILPLPSRTFIPEETVFPAAKNGHTETDVCDPRLLHEVIAGSKDGAKQQSRRHYLPLTPSPSRRSAAMNGAGAEIEAPVHHERCPPQTKLRRSRTARSPPARRSQTREAPPSRRRREDEAGEAPSMKPDRTRREWRPPLL